MAESKKKVYVYIAVRTNDRGGVIGYNGVFLTKKEADANSWSEWGAQETCQKVEAGADLAALLAK